jgi:TolB-like protein/Tfp pilus assembly protein PilF/predicted Ser/Thr protein kinase
MGEVYRARDVRLDRTVAVKILPAELAADETYRQRFEREARAASALSHAHIAHLYDVGEQDGTHFIAMELVEGESLRELVSRGPLDVDRVVDCGLQMASALEAAHDAGIVHRDIKSANAVVSGKGQVKVLDFGLARRSRDDESALDSQMSTQAQTRVGTVMGTVPYMSPEQALGKDVDARTDLFSLGVVLYELATGRLPFRGDTSAQTIDQICHSTPEPLGALNREIPAELERIVRKCLEKDRSRRYTTARDLVVDLRNLQRDRELGSGPATAPGPRAPRRRSLALVAGVVAALLMVGAGAVYYWRVPAGPSIGSLAVLPFDNATGDESLGYLGDGISESLINTLSRLPELKVISRRSAFAFKGEDQDPPEIGRRLGVDALVLGRLAQRGDELAISAELVDVRDDTQVWGARYRRPADDVMAVEREIASTIAGTLRRRLSGEDEERLARRATSDPEAYRLYLKGREFLVGSQREMDRSVESFRQAIARDPEYALAHAGLASAYAIQAYLRGMDREEVLDEARASVERALALDPDLAEAHAARGMVLFYFEWDWAGAEAALTRALELDPGSAPVHEEYGNVLMSMGRLDEGLAESGRAWELDPLSVGPMHDIAINYMVRGDYPQAEAHFRKAIEVNPNWTWGYIKLARTLAHQGECEEALARAETGYQRVADGVAPTSRAWLAVTWALCGQTDRAREQLAWLQDLARSQYVDPTPTATVLTYLGRTDEALDHLERAFEERSPAMVYMKLVPRLDPSLADDPRTRSLIRRMGFPGVDG